MANGFRDEHERRVIDKAVMTIAIARKSHTQIEDDADDFDAALNALCEKWYEEFKDKDEVEMAEFLLRQNNGKGGEVNG